MRTPSGLNRVGLLLFGLALGALSGYGLARSYGAFGSGHQHEPLLSSEVQDFIARNESWFWLAAAGIALVLAVLGALWLRAQLRFPRPPNEDLTRASDTGRVTVKGAAPAQAVVADLQAVADIKAASARVSGDPAAPSVYLRVDVPDNARLLDLRDDFEHSLERLRLSLQVERTRTFVDLHITGGGSRSVQ